MNIITFNDVFEHPFCKIEDVKNWDAVRKSPLFVHELDFQMSLRRYMDDGRESLTTSGYFPYPRFRLCLNLSDHDSKTSSEEHYLVSPSGRGGFMIYYFVARHNAFLKSVKANVMMRYELKIDEGEYGRIDPDEIRCLVIGHTQWLNLPDYVSFIRSSKVWQYGPEDDPEKLVQESAVGSTALLGVFVMDAMTPTNHIVVVRPDKNGKSVQWVEQRTHYTLIHHGHPANRKEVTEGQDVNVNTKEEMTRMAHGRRAHKRTLRHERYRYARGKTIFVRATWVGPKEWKEKGSKQIYKILDPVE